MKEIKDSFKPPAFILTDLLVTLPNAAVKSI